MAYKFSQDTSTRTIHIFGCDLGGVIESKISICGIEHEKLSKIVDAVYNDEDGKDLAKRAFKLKFIENKKLCSRCVGSIYGEIED